MSIKTLLLVGLVYYLYTQMSGAGSRVITSFNTLQDANAFQAAGGTILRPNGTPYALVPFMGGYLYDGLPLNVQMGMGWLPGQQAALAAAGRSF